MKKAMVNHEIQHFSLIDQNSAIITLEKLLNSKYIVLYFYPKDNTPG